MIEVLANWGEFIGGVAVVFSLVYVGIQVRNSNRQARIDSYAKVGELFGNWTSSIYEDEDTCRIWVSGLQNFNALNENERMRFGLMASMFFGIVDTVIVMNDRGFYDFPESFEGHLKNARLLYKRPGLKDWSSTPGATMSPHVMRYLDQAD